MQHAGPGPGVRALGDNFETDTGRQVLVYGGKPCTDGPTGLARLPGTAIVQWFGAGRRRGGKEKKKNFVDPFLTQEPRA